MHHGLLFYYAVHFLPSPACAAGLTLSLQSSPRSLQVGKCTAYFFTVFLQLYEPPWPCTVEHNHFQVLPGGFLLI